jgi:hypothetical protein
MAKKGFWHWVEKILNVPNLVPDETSPPLDGTEALKRDETPPPPDEMEELKQLESDINVRSRWDNIKIARGGSIAEMSGRLGFDWRDLKSAGYSDAQIDGVLQGKYTLDELFKMKPDGKPQ